MDLGDERAEECQHHCRGGGGGIILSLYLEFHLNSSLNSEAMQMSIAVSSTAIYDPWSYIYLCIP